MSAADVALIVDGAKDLALIACGTVLAWKALGRMRLVAPPRETPEPDAPQPPARPLTATAPHPLPPQAAQRQEAYNRLVAEGKTSAEAAAELGITAPRTAWDYEKRRVAMLAAQDGATT